MNTQLDPLIQNKLAEFATRRRRLIITRGVLSAVGMLLFALLVVAAIDFTWDLPDWARWSLSSAAYLAAIVVAWRHCLSQLVHAPDARQLARLVECAEPKLREDLLSAVELGDTHGQIFDSEQFRLMLQQDVAHRMEDVEVRSLLPVALIRRYIGYSLVILAAIVGIGVASGGRLHALLLRALLPGANLERVSRTKVIVLEPESGDQIVPQGDTVRVVVELGGEPANRARIETFGEKEGWHVMDMQPLGNDRFAATVQVGRESVRYRIKAGDALTAKYLLDARERPFANVFEKSFTYPAYTELPAKTVTEPDGGIVAIEGTQVDLKLKPNQAIKGGELRIELGKTSSTVPLTSMPDGRLTARIPVTASGSYRVHLVAAETGFENKFSPENEIRAEPDLVPTVELESPKTDLLLPANELVEMTGNASDDFGLAKVSQLVKINDGGWRETELAKKPGKKFRIDHRWDLFTLGVKPGDLVTTKLVARDMKGSKGESRPLQVTITASGFEMRRLQSLDGYRALNDSLRSLAENAAQLAKGAGAANNDFQRGVGGESAGGQAAMTVIAALGSFDTKFTEAWTTLGSVLRQAPAGHASAELAMLGRELSRANSGEAKIAKANADFVNANPAVPAAKELFGEIANACNRMEQRVRLASSVMEGFVGSAEYAILFENGQVVARELARLAPLIPSGSSAAEKWAPVLSRLRVSVSQAKLIEDLLEPMAARGDSLVRESARTSLSTWSRARADIARLLAEPKSTGAEPAGPSLPTAALLRANTEFTRVATSVSKHFGTWHHDFGLARSVRLNKELAADAGPVYANVGRLQQDLDSLLANKGIPAELRTALTDSRWGIRGELFKGVGDIEEIRAQADNHFVSDLRRATAALEALHAVAAGTERDVIRGKFTDLDSAMRVLESGHEIQELFDGFNRLAVSERWEAHTLMARTAAPGDWRWLEADVPMVVERLRKAKPEGAADELRAAFAGAQDILHGAVKSGPWNSVDEEMDGRAKMDNSPKSARKEAELLAGQMKRAVDLFRPHMAEARRKLAKIAPPISELAAAIAKEQQEAKAETEKVAQQKPAEAKSEAARQLAHQQQINRKVEALKDLIRAEANRQNILDKEQRETMRDADDALALLKDPPPKAEEALQDAAKDPVAQQKADIERATEQQQKLADALQQIAKHFDAKEQGKPVEETRTALREAEKELGIKEQLDKDAAHAQMLAEMAQKPPAELLKELEAKIPQNPEMKKELSGIAKEALADATEKLANAANQENKIAQKVGEQAKQEEAKSRQAQQNAAEAAKQAVQAAQAAQKAAETAQQQAKNASNPEAEQQAGKAANEAAKAAEDAQQAVQSAEQMAKAGTPQQAAEAAKQTAQKAGEAAKAAEQSANDAKQAQNSAQAAAQKGEHQAENQQAGQKSAEAAHQAEKAAQAAKNAQNLAQAAANEAAAMAQAAKPDAQPASAQQAADTAAQAAQKAAEAAKAAQQSAQVAQQQAKDAGNPQAEQQAAKAAGEAGDAAKSAEQAAQSAEKIAKTGDAAQAAQAAQQAAQKAGEAAQAADKAAGDAQAAQASAEQAAQKGGDQQAGNQQAGQKAGEAAKQAQAAAQSAKQAQAAAQQAAQQAAAMAQQNPQLAKAAQQQQPIAQNAADAGAEVARAGRHEQRLGNQPTGEQLADLGAQIEQTAANAVPAAQKALDTAKAAADAAGAVGEASAQLSKELSALNNAANGAPDSPQGAQPAGQQPAQAGQPAGQQAAQSGQPAGQPGGQPAGQQSAAAPPSSPAEQQAMARALDALDQQLNPGAAAAAGEQAGQAGQQPGQEAGQPGAQPGQPGSQPGQPGSQPGQPGQPGGPPGESSSPSQSAMAAAAQSAAASMRMTRAESASTQPGSLVSANQSSKSMGGAQAQGGGLDHQALPGTQGLKNGEWGKLPKKLAEQLTKGQQEAIPGDYRQAVETYYRVVAEKAKKQ